MCHLSCKRNSRTPPELADRLWQFFRELKDQEPNLHLHAPAAARLFSDDKVGRWLKNAKELPIDGERVRIKMAGFP
jgi:hypothetical protein